MSKDMAFAFSVTLVNEDLSSLSPIFFSLYFEHDLLMHESKNLLQKCDVTCRHVSYSSSNVSTCKE